MKNTFSTVILLCILLQLDLISKNCLHINHIEKYGFNKGKKCADNKDITLNIQYLHYIHLSSYLLAFFFRGTAVPKILSQWLKKGAKLLLGSWWCMS